MSVEEREPLLASVEDACKAAPPTADAHRLLQTSKYLSANTPWHMFLRNTAGWAVLVFTSSGSCVFLMEMYETFTPKCHALGVDARLGTSILCYATGICFWTFPFVCMLAAVATFGANLYNVRLYYECLLHRIMLNYDNNKVIKSFLTWFVALYGALALSAVFFLHNAPRVTKSIEFAVNRGLIVYGAPLVSCLVAVASQRQLEWHLIPLPKFYETDPDLATRVLSESVFVPEAHLQAAFEEMEERLDEQPPAGPLTSAAYFGLLAQTARRAVGPLSAEEAVESEEAEPWHSRVLARLDMKKTEEFTSKCPEVRRPEVLTVWYQARKGGFWIHRLLHSRHLQDERSASFRFWARCHVALTLLASLMIAEIYVAVLRDFVRYQEAA